MELKELMCEAEKHIRELRVLAIKLKGGRELLRLNEELAPVVKGLNMKFRELRLIDEKKIIIKIMRYLESADNEFVHHGCQDKAIKILEEAEEFCSQYQ